MAGEGQIGTQFGSAWREHRPVLVDLAYRMLGDVGEAEDVVQEAFSRLLGTGLEDIEDKRGWLIVVTSRLCLDQVRSARSRRERPEDSGVIDRTLAASGPGMADPADRVSLDDSVRLALLVVLERLSPAERVVFVLHDIFAMPFEEIGGTIGKSAPACRQLARRARTKIEERAGPGRFSVPTAQHRRVTERFITACAEGDLEELIDLLDPQAWGEVDLIPGRVVMGAGEIAVNLLRYWGPEATLVSAPASRRGDQPVLLAFVDRQLAGVLALTMGDTHGDTHGDVRIAGIRVVADPDKLAFVRTQLSPRT